jgi:tRNA(Ile)-lysidine synthase
MEAAELRARVQDHIRRLELIPRGGEVTVLVSGGADSTCAWHVLRELGYRVSALHVDHGLRGRDSDDDARFCRDVLGAEIVDGRAGRGIARDAVMEGAPASPVRPGPSEAELREIRYAVAIDRLRATGHTASDQVETILYRLVTSGRTTGIKAGREDGIVRPLLPIWHAETVAYCEAVGIGHREDASNSDTVRGLIREQILPLLREIHPAADANLLRVLEERRELPAALAELLDSPTASKRLDLGGGLQAVREYDRLWLEAGPIPLEGHVRWGEWTIETELAGLKVRGWRPGDRLAGRRKKIQDVFVDAKIPRSDREAWPLVVRGNEVVAVPGIVEAEGVRAVRITNQHRQDTSNAIRGRADMRGATAANIEEGGARGKQGFPRESEPKAQRNVSDGT